MIERSISQRSKATVLVALCFLAGACQDPQAQLREESLEFVSGWFAEAASGARADTLCHGLGTLKHPEITCAEMLDHAARIDPASRRIAELKPRDCFGDVCGVFVEIEFNSIDSDGNEVLETALLKRDEGQLRMYWYRTDSLLTLLRPAEAADESEEKEPLQAAYDEITARYPALYSYPPCYGIRPSSSNMVGALQPLDAIDVTEVEQLAAACGDRFCFALVGNKIATLCPPEQF